MHMSNISDISVKQLKRAIVIRERVARLQAELSSILGTSAGSISGGVKRRRKMSPAAREKIAAAQRRRWAAVKAAKGKG
jgi:hypothetical protein